MKGCFNMSEKAVIYTRKSKADEGNTLEVQKAKLLAYCQLNDLQVVEVIEEYGVSGTIPLNKRPGGSKIDKHISDNSISHIVALKLDRMFRNTQDCLDRTTKWENDGVSLHLVEMGGSSINTGSAIGKLFISLTASFATFERDLIAERTASSLRYKKKNNKVFGHTPFGWDRVDMDLIKNNKEQEIIDEVIMRRGAGETLNSIATSLNNRGIKGKTGGKFYPSSVDNIIKYRESLSALQG